MHKIDEQKKRLDELAEENEALKLELQAERENKAAEIQEILKKVEAEKAVSA